MLVLLPPSETKNASGRGRPLDLGRLSFGELTAAREEVAAALVATSAREDALERLKVPAGVAADVERNLRLVEHPTSAAERVYTGVLYDAFDLESLPTEARSWARRRVVIMSALFGAVRLTDPIPAYRLPIGARVQGVGSLERHWREALPEPLTRAAGRGVVLDCRSSGYVAMWRPAGDLAQRWVRIRVPGASHHAKHTRGRVARHLSLIGSAAREVPEVAEQLGLGFGVELHEPERTGQPWVLDVSAGSGPGA